MTPSDSTAVATASNAEIEALLNQQAEEFDADLVQTPILKIGQPLTKEVQAEQAEPGEFINTLTGDGIGTKIGFVVAYYQKGRFGADRDSGRAFVAFGKEIPEQWEPLVGEDFVGTPFDEYPDAEEQYKARVNRKEIDWGKGPLVSTTHNFTGLAVVSGAEGEEDELQPVRLSLQRTNMPAVRKWLTLIKSMRQAQWDRVFDLGTEKRQFDRGTAHLLSVRLGRESTADEKQAAVELALAVQAGRTQDNQATDAAADKPAEPDAKGGLSV